MELSQDTNYGQHAYITKTISNQKETGLTCILNLHCLSVGHAKNQGLWFFSMLTAKQYVGTVLLMDKLSTYVFM